MRYEPVRLNHCWVIRDREWRAICSLPVHGNDSRNMRVLTFATEGDAQRWADAAEPRTAPDSQS